ncbi:hypothetical protein BKA58DRAFT_149950 [Alternaria rosae]|uniref:uncharacterized protein n=1 Tax=Alternaria rosae TaxID=1187941 RepID=UPI001E8E9017|nr:uncharacterized protein BKA58DRAFT_149950 [Alternaria rosae]KAH6872653.1 hypothetical protein BKA58DRAFT_149950 [Alternaria rosae]
MSSSTSSTQPATHILSLTNYTTHHLVSINLKPITSLPPSSLRLCTKILGLTTNNLSYARIGHLMGWYDTYPLPSTTPPPCNDPTKYGRVAAWGYAEILESTVEGIEKGMSVYGYLPSSTEWEDVTVERAKDVRDGRAIQDQIVVVDGHRQHLWKLYNRYRVCGPLPQLAGKIEGKDELGWVALMMGPFTVGHNLCCYVFPWQGEEEDIQKRRINPTGNGEWSAEDADLGGATVVLLNASGKTASCFAYALRHCRSVGCQPDRIIGVGSKASIDAMKKTGWYDNVVVYDDFDSTLKQVKDSGTKRTLLFDFGARPGANANWRSALSSLTPDIPFTLVTVGGEVAPQDPGKAAQRLADRASLNIVNASLLQEKGIDVAGQRYFKDLYAAFEAFWTRARDLEMLKLKWGEGLDGWDRGWELLCRDKVRANVGLVYNI